MFDVTFLRHRRDHAVSGTRPAGTARGAGSERFLIDCGEGHATPTAARRQRFSAGSAMSY